MAVKHTGPKLTQKASQDRRGSKQVSTVLTVIPPSALTRLTKCGPKKDQRLSMPLIRNREPEDRSAFTVWPWES